MSRDGQVACMSPAEATSEMADALRQETTEAQLREGEADEAGLDRAANCDRNYGTARDASGHLANGCVPADHDYDCPELQAMGLGEIEIVGQDWQRLDGLFDFDSQTWTIPPDGVGCEWNGQG